MKQQRFVHKQGELAGLHGCGYVELPFAELPHMIFIRQPRPEPGTLTLFSPFDFIWFLITHQALQPFRFPSLLKWMAISYLPQPKGRSPFLYSQVNVHECRAFSSYFFIFLCICISTYLFVVFRKVSQS